MLQKKRGKKKSIELNIGDKAIKSEPWVKLLGIKIDNKLNFDLHIFDLCKPVSGKLNALIRLKSFLHFEPKCILTQF